MQPHGASHFYKQIITSIILFLYKRWFTVQGQNQLKTVLSVEPSPIVFF